MKEFTSEALWRKYYRDYPHPYTVYENEIMRWLEPSDVLLDAGCGRTAPVLIKFADKAKKVIGVDLEKSACSHPKLQYICSDISNIDMPDASVDMVISRAVLEHVEYPEKVFSEVSRILKAGGHFISLVPNYYDYASLVSFIVPNKFHKTIVANAEGRDVNDTFKAYYRANTHGKLKRLADGFGFKIGRMEYVNQYPNYFMFNPYLFLLGTLYERVTSRFQALRFLRGWLLFDLRRL